MAASAANALASGFLSVETTPSGVEIWAARSGETRMQYLGDSPLDSRELKSGTYGLWLISGKDTVAIPGVVLSEGQHTQVTREMPANYGSLKVRTDPDSGEIWLDGVKLGNAPYYNNLMLPGVYSLKLVPREAQHRARSEKLTVKKGDTLDFDRPFSFRDKSFLEENLSARPWALQLEFGYRFGSVFGAFDSSGKRKNFPDTAFPGSSKRKQNDFPLTARLGLPFGLETHFQWPFESHDNKGAGAVFPRDLLLGLKYTFRPMGLGLDVSYSFGSDTSGGGFNHDRLILTAIGDYAKGSILLQANGGYAFHFSDADSSHLNPGDVLFLNGRLGYVVGPFLPYVGALADFTMDGDSSGTSIPGGHLVSLEPGLVCDISDFASLQLGVPFALFGNNEKEYWALHFSLALRVGLK